MSPWTESHSELVQLFNLNDKANARLYFARVEYSPKDLSHADDLSTYALKFDEERKPSWWADEIEEDVETRMKAYIKRIIISGDVALLCGGQFILAKGAKVESAHSMVINAMLDGSTVDYIRGGTVNDISGGTVNYISGGTVNDISGGTVYYIRGGTVKYISGGTVNHISGGTVKYIRGGTVNHISGGTVNYISGGTVNDIRGGTVTDIGGGTVNDISGGTVNYIGGGTVNHISGGTVNDIKGGTVNDIRGGTIVRLQNYWGDLVVKNISKLAKVVEDLRKKP